MKKLKTSDLVNEFNSILNTTWSPTPDFFEKTENFLATVPSNAISKKSERRKLLCSVIRSKFHLNRKASKALIDNAAQFSVYFDPIDKNELISLFDTGNHQQFNKWLESKKLPVELRKFFNPISDIEAIKYFVNQTIEATINRSDARIGVQAERKSSMFEAHFGSWLFSITNKKNVISFNTGLSKQHISKSYIDYLKSVYPESLNRNCGLYVINIDKKFFKNRPLKNIRKILFLEIEKAYVELANYSYLALIFSFQETSLGNGGIWELINDATIFSERHRQAKLKTGFFHPSKIEEVTKTHIHSIDPIASNFADYQHAFLFRDCIVTGNEMISANLSQTEIKYVILLIEKNETDETPIPCPECWSLKIRGNSYPVLGVKSWECHNWLCSDRSAFNRGHRFSLSSILRERATLDRKTYIPEKLLSEWKLDVTGDKGLKDILDMLIQNYSLPEDGVKIVNSRLILNEHLGRNIICKMASGKDYLKIISAPSLEKFQKSNFFHRFLHPKSILAKRYAKKINTKLPWLTVYLGDCIGALQKIEKESIDGAVTSPPYYNAREYSSWPNIYCYLYDIKLAAEGVYRALKPGSYYLFNIFDYFDNDNIIAFSTLGKRRLCLGAYITQIFRHVGFELQSNIVWHKGQIEGKRNYNQGNRAPFYQLPLNTWEHILVFRKGGRKSDKLVFPSVIHCRPVMKWFNGKNLHGHTAPFPIEIPLLLCDQLHKDTMVLDPYGGSFTTALACQKKHQKCTVVELHDKYCELGLSRINPIQNELKLFDA